MGGGRRFARPNVGDLRASATLRLRLSLELEVKLGPGLRHSPAGSGAGRVATLTNPNRKRRRDAETSRSAPTRVAFNSHARNYTIIKIDTHEPNPASPDRRR